MGQGWVRAGSGLGQGWRQQRLQRWQQWQQWQWQWRQRQPWQWQQGLRRRQWRQRQRLQPWLFGEPPLNRVRGTPLHPDAMGCLCCRHKPTDYDKLLEPNPERPIYDAQGYALDKVTRRRLQRTYSSEFSGTEHHS